MTPAAAASPDAARRRHLLDRLAGLVPAMQRRAPALDASAAFPAEDIGALRDLGLPASPLPIALGGLGMGTEHPAAMDVMDALRLLGQGNLSVGRLIEAHVNAIRLIVRYGSQAQVERAAHDALAGHLFGLWVTDAPGAPLRIGPDGHLQGAKAPCSGAGHATRALVTAEDAAGDTIMLVIAPDDRARASHGGWAAGGMRAAANGHMDLSGLPAGNPIGVPGDYLRQPDFSAGAWRTSAVTLGGVETLVAAMRDALVARRRDGNPHQQARMGEALIARDTIRLWVRRAADIAENPRADPDETAATVNLARIAVEAAALRAIGLVQRALGLSAFRQGSLTELLFRDLAIYLRQPAPDETLTEAAAYFLRRPGAGEQTPAEPQPVP